MKDDRMDEDDKLNVNDVDENDKGDLGVQDINVDVVVGVDMGRSEDVPEGGGGHRDEARSSAEDEIGREVRGRERKIGWRICTGGERKKIKEDISGVRLQSPIQSYRI